MNKRGGVDRRLGAPRPTGDALHDPQHLDAGRGLPLAFPPNKPLQPISAGTLGRRDGAVHVRYFSEDIAYFVGSSPYLTLAKPRGAVSFLMRRVEYAEECALALRAYPSVLIEPLEFFYTCLRSLGALDLPFFEALLLEHTWRGAVWASWLAMLEPSDALVGALRRAGGRYPHNEWLVDCAISTIEGRAPAPEHEAFVTLAERCRLALKAVPRPVMPLRPEPTEAEISLMNLEREHTRLCYKSMGPEAALQSIQGTLVGFYAQDYLRWLRSLAAQPAAAADAAAQHG